MAKDTYRATSTVELIGTIDKNNNDEIVVIVDGAKDEPPTEVAIIELLANSLGKQISAKITEEVEV